MSLTARDSLVQTGTFRRYSRMIEREEDGFSLVEILVVMTILAILAALTWSGFYGMRNAMILHQNAESVRGNIVSAQRSAMLLDRDSGENWVRGIGIDLNSFVSKGTYTMFKWCSGGPFYTNFDTNDSIPTLYDSSCSGASEVLVAVDGNRNIGVIGGDLATWVDAKDPSQMLYNVKYVVYESVTGRVHFYNEAGTRIGNLEWLRITYDRANRYDSVVIESTGNVRLQTYDPNVPSPVPEFKMAGPDPVPEDLEDIIIIEPPTEPYYKTL